MVPNHQNLPNLAAAHHARPLLHPRATSQAAAWRCSKRRKTTLNQPTCAVAWDGLLINAINSIPAGELNGGRISFSLWGRKAATRLSGITLALLGVLSFVNDVAFYWVVLIFFLQRGPIAPLSDEITEPENKHVALGVAILLLGLLICLLYPFPFFIEGIGIDDF